jgi:hypothetical protein
MDYIELYETRKLLEDTLFEAANFMAYEGKLTRKEFDNIVKIDPTPTKTYAKWLLARYMALGGDPELQRRFFEDGDRVQAALTLFDKIKKKKLEGVNIDIMTYKSIQDLEDVTDRFVDREDELKTTTQMKHETKLEGAKKLYEDDDWLILIPLKVEAAIFYGAGTRWCTAAQNNSMFSHYTKGGSPLIIIIDKNKEREGKRDATSKYQFHLGSNQFMDAQDRGIGYSGVIELMKRMPPGAQQALKDQGINPITFELMRYFEYNYRRGDKEIPAERVKQLLQAGADPHFQNEAVLKWAVQTGEASLVDMLIADPKTDREVLADMVTESAKVGNLDFVKKIVAAAGPGALNANGGKTLIAACATNLELVQYVVENGGDVNVSRGEPLATACANGKLSIARYLLEHGADPNANNSVAYWRAYKNKRPKTLELLLSFGAKPA